MSNFKHQFKVKQFRFIPAAIPLAKHFIRLNQSCV